MSLVEIRDLVKEYAVKGSLVAGLTGRGSVVHAISGVSLDIQQGEVLGLVGESGCGKTTMGKVLVRLERPTRGAVFLEGQDVSTLPSGQLRLFRRKVQMVFQDPYESLNPRRRVIDIVTEPLRYLRLGGVPADRAHTVLEQVELIPADLFSGRWPHQLSGGQRQRVAIARALIVEPEFIVADEPVSMLDVSVRGGVLNLLQRLNRELGITILLITHDLATARHLCHRLATMYLGKLVEVADTEDYVTNPCHPYSRLLIASVPDLYRERQAYTASPGEISSAINPPHGCRFWPRCPYVIDRCRTESPELSPISRSHQVACHRAGEV